MYLIEGMPCMEGTEFLAYLDVPKNKRDEWDVVENDVGAALVSDSPEYDRELKTDAVSIIVGGRHMIAFHTAEGGVIWLDEDKLSPLAAAEWRFFLRASETGETYIAVFEGLYLIALLSYELTAEVMPGEGLAGRLLELAGCGQRTEGRLMMEDDENEEDVVGALKEMYGGADGDQ